MKLSFISKLSGDTVGSSPSLGNFRRMHPPEISEVFLTALVQKPGCRSSVLQGVRSLSPWPLQMWCWGGPHSRDRHRFLSFELQILSLLCIPENKMPERNLGFLIRFEIPYSLLKFTLWLQVLLLICQSLTVYTVNLNGRFCRNRVGISSVPLSFK